MQLRAMLGELGCISISNIFAIPLVQNALEECGTPIVENLVPNAQKLIGELEWHAHAMRTQRLAHGLPGAKS